MLNIFNFKLQGHHPRSVGVPRGPREILLWTGAQSTSIGFRFAVVVAVGSEATMPFSSGTRTSSTVCAVRLGKLSGLGHKVKCFRAQCVISGRFISGRF